MILKCGRLTESPLQFVWRGGRHTESPLHFRE